MHRAIAACFLAVAAIGCSFGSSEVVRLHDGRPRVERFVSEGAYAASLEAALAEERGDWTAAVAALERARDQDPDAPDLEARLGLALCHLGKREAAEFAFDDAMRSGDLRERVYTSRAQCDVLHGDVTRARADLVLAIADDPDAIEPALILVKIDFDRGDLHAARARAEEAALLHPESAAAQRVLAEVLVRVGDLQGAVDAANAASRLDEDEGARARAAVVAAADASGVATYALQMRGRRLEAVPSYATETDARCAKLFDALRAIVTRGRADEIATAAEGVRASCPADEPEATLLELEAEWSPKNAEAIEARAFASASSRARRWASRMRLRRSTTDELLANDALPRADDAETLALHLAATALQRARSKETKEAAGAMALADVARSLALAEPTVARLVAEVARLAGKPAGDPRRTTACALARTKLEKQGCGA